MISLSRESAQEASFVCSSRQVQLADVFLVSVYLSFLVLKASFISLGVTGPLYTGAESGLSFSAAHQAHSIPFKCLL